jgi:hypothetical protein
MVDQGPAGRAGDAEAPAKHRFTGSGDDPALSGGDGGDSSDGGWSFWGDDGGESSGGGDGGG